MNLDCISECFLVRVSMKLSLLLTFDSAKIIYCLNWKNSTQFEISTKHSILFQQNMNFKDFVVDLTSFFILLTLILSQLSFDLFWFERQHLRALLTTNRHFIKFNVTFENFRNVEGWYIKFLLSKLKNVRHDTKLRIIEYHVIGLIRKKSYKILPQPHLKN